MNTVLSLVIMLSYTSLKKDINYAISKFIVENVYRIEHMTVREIANECYTSTSSIIKYCQLLGYDNFSSFKSHLISTVKIRKSQINQRYQYFNEKELIDLIKNISKNTENDWNQFINHLDLLFENIKESKSISIIGASFPLALCQSFQEDLIIMGKPVMVQQISEESIEYYQDKLYIIISLTGRYFINYRNYYNELIHSSAKVGVISQKIQRIDQPDIFIDLPIDKDNEYNDIVILCILDYIKYKYFLYMQSLKK